MALLTWKQRIISLNHGKCAIAVSCLRCIRCIRVSFRALYVCVRSFFLCLASASALAVCSCMCMHKYLCLLSFFLWLARGLFRWVHYCHAPRYCLDGFSSPLTRARERVSCMFMYVYARCLFFLWLARGPFCWVHYCPFLRSSFLDAIRWHQI